MCVPLFKVIPYRVIPNWNSHDNMCKFLNQNAAEIFQMKNTVHIFGLKVRACYHCYEHHIQLFFSNCFHNLLHLLVSLHTTNQDWAPHFDA